MCIIFKFKKTRRWSFFSNHGSKIVSWYNSTQVPEDDIDMYNTFIQYFTQIEHLFFDKS